MAKVSEKTQYPGVYAETIADRKDIVYHVRYRIDGKEKTTAAG